jgi:hypothetical protein
VVCPKPRIGELGDRNISSPMNKFALLLALPLVAQQNPAFKAPDTIEVKRDVVYATIAARQMHLDVFLPKTW